MTTTNKPKAVFWIIAVVGLIWNAMGVMNYLMQAYNTASFREQYDEAQLALIDASPAWLTGVFAVAVFAGILGALLLLLRRKLAVPLFGLSLIAVLIQMGYAWFATSSIEVFGTVAGIVMPLIVIIISIFLYFYSKGASRNGWLR